MTAAISEEYKCLVDILTCLVCKDMVTKAHICPNCSKFYCLDCIIRQLAVEETCLNCNKFLEVSMLVNCQQLCSQLNETLEKVSHKKPGSVKPTHQKISLYCGKHRLEKTYYCKTCEKPLCSDCSVLTENHRGHDFVKLSLIKNTFEAKIHEKVDQINAVQKNIQKKLELQEVIRHKKDANNLENLVKFENSVKILKEELKKKLKKILNDGQIMLQKITEKIQSQNNTYDTLMSRLKKCSKGKFVEKEYDILEKELFLVLSKMDIEDQNDKNQLNLNRKAKQLSISYISPVYEEFAFVIDHYSIQSSEMKQGFFYTKSIKASTGLQWRLKVYPDGINHSQQQSNKIENQGINHMKKPSKHGQEYFAIFIEFVSGCVQTTRQKYSLTLINHADNHKNFTRQFQSEFDIGECWGYEHFIKLNQMNEEEYYNRDDDSIEIVLKICPSSFYQAAKDQQALIRQKQRILAEQAELLSRLQNSPRSSKRLPSTSSLIELNSSTTSIE